MSEELIQEEPKVEEAHIKYKIEKGNTVIALENGAVFSFPDPTSFDDAYKLLEIFKQILVERQKAVEEAAKPEVVEEVPVEVITE